jgi:predicted RNase H-like HicB family nuclease
MESIKAIITWDDNFGVFSDLLPGCVATHATLEGVKNSFEEAVKHHLAGIKEDGEEIPSQFLSEYSYDYNLNTRALLKAMDGKVSRAAIARASGINERQLGHYITGRVVPRPENRRKVVEGLHRIASELLKVV